MLWVKAFHLISMVAWFAGLFYLPRLFVYHADTEDVLSSARFKVMERRLYYGIMWPAGLLTTGFGLWLMIKYEPYLMQMLWMRAKLSLVLFVWVYHVCCGVLMQRFEANKNKYSTLFFRLFNELPTLFLIAIILLVVVKPV